MKIIFFIMLATMCIHLEAIKRRRAAPVSSTVMHVYAAKKRALLNELHQQQYPESARMVAELAAIITAPGAMRAYVDPETAHIGTDTLNHD